MSVVGHDYVYDFADASGFVKCSIYVVDRNGFRKLPGRELALGYEVSIYEVPRRAGVYHRFHGGFFYGIGCFHMDWEHDAFGVHFKGVDY